MAVSVPIGWPFLKAVTRSWPSSSTAAAVLRVEVMPLRVTWLPLIVRLIFARLTSSSGAFFPCTVPVSRPVVVLSTKLVTVTLRPA